MKNMKKIMVLLCAMLCCNAMSAQNNFYMSGKFADVKNDTMKVEFVKREPEKEIVSIKVPVNAKGEFSFGCRIANAYKCSMALNSGKEENYIFIVPDEKAVINGTFSQPHDWQISGSAFYQSLSKVMAVRRPYLKEFDKSMADYEKGLAAGGDEKTLKEQRAETNMDINKRMGELALEYISQHPNDEASMAFIGDGAFTYLEKEMKLFSPEIRNGRFNKFLDTYQSMIDRYTQGRRATQKAKMSIEEGKMAPDFTLKDMNGNDFRLSSLYNKGKYVIVDFWGSWCTWCVNGFPKMKEYYEKYKDRIEIVGVDCSDKVDKWKAAVKKSGITWQQVRSEDGTTEVTFGVKGYPHKVIITPEGKVLKIITGESDDFYNLLDATLK
jgi:thiol-disulfide isomerase/thioredoxin